MFNDKYSHQYKGTAMETKLAPTYATLGILDLEETLYKNTNKVFGEEFNQITGKRNLSTVLLYKYSDFHMLNNDIISR